MSWLHRVRRKFFGVNGEKSGELFPKRGKEGEKGRNPQNRIFRTLLPARTPRPRRQAPSRPGRALRPHGSTGHPGGLSGTVPRDAAMGDTRQGGDLRKYGSAAVRPEDGRRRGSVLPETGVPSGRVLSFGRGGGNLRGSFIYKCMRRPPGGGYCRAGTARGREGLPAVFRGRGRRKTVK